MERPIVRKRWFMLGVDRSGTSLVRRILDSHSMIACPAEAKFIFQLIKVIQTEQSYRGLTSMGLERRDILKRLADFIDSIMDEYAAKNNKKIWVEKTTHNLFYADLLDEIFEQDVSYIGLIRHGLDVAFSLEDVKHSPFTVIERFKEEGDDRATMAMRFWKAQNRKLLNLKEKFGPRLKIFKYEDLTANPKQEFRKMFDNIGVDFEESVVDDYNKVYHTKGYEDPKAVESEKIIRNSNNFRSWEKPKQERLFELAKEELLSFDYTL